MENEDFASDSDESDEDFRPEGAQSDVPSEDESGSCISDDNNDQEPTKQKTKIKKKRKQRAKPNTQNANQSESDNEEKTSETELNEEEEKKRADALWADFLSDTPKTSTQNGNSAKKSATVTSASTSTKTLSPPKSKSQEKEPEKIEVTEIFDFAGEEVRITKEIDKTQTDEKTTTSKIPPKGPTKRPGGGLNSILGQINKKNKITVLEKTKLDWDHFKKAEGLNEELQTFNKGKDGFLEKQDFLQRTDVRQFEIEKNLRHLKRSNR